MILTWSRNAVVSIAGFVQVWLVVMLCLSVKRIVAQDIFRIACGNSGNLTDDQGQMWHGDVNLDKANSYLNLGQSQDIAASTLVANADVPSVPYLTARMFTSPASYSFPVSVGRHWIRLHFYPFAYETYDPAHAIVSVKTDTFDLMTSVNVSQELLALNFAYLYREFCFNVTSSPITLTFLPGSAPNAYAMVSGIEIQSMPDLFSSSLTAAELQTTISYPMPFTAMETMYRLNVGGQAVLQSNDALGRSWDTDTQYLVGAATGVQSSVTNNITYSSLNPVTAPQDVYRTARFMTNDNSVNLNFNLTWNLSVDPNFTYYVRLHFCEIQYSKINYRVFDIYLNGFLVTQNYDVIAVTSNEFQATILEFSVTSQPYVTLQLHPTNNTSPQFFNAILNGLEIFKLNDSAGNLQGPHPVPLAVPSSSLGSTQTTSASNKVPIIGGVSGGLAALIALIVLSACFCQWRKKGEYGSSPSWLPLPIHGGNSHSMASKLSTASKKSGTGSYASSAPSNLCRYFSFAEILEITNKFDEARVLGVGGFGKVYKGVLEDGTYVAVKRGNPSSEQGVTEFQTEIELLSKLRHRHLVSLIGFCEEHSEMILVYDYMANGPLRGHLYGAGLPPLSWKQRLEICIGAAKGLHYLHTGSAQGIIHRDVKTTNILLDESFISKVSDFGLSKTGPSLDHTHVSTAVKGSFGYLDPDYFRRQQLTEKSDVYSFGVVLLEVLCARPAINPTLPREQVNMAEWAMLHQKKDMLDQIIDPFLMGRISKDSMKKFAETAEKCLAESGADRPTMGDILWNLEYALQLHQMSAEKELDISHPHLKEVPRKSMPEVELPSMAAVKLDNRRGTMNSTAFSEDSDELSATAVFSQLVRPEGR